MATTGIPDIDESYFVNKYLTQTIQDYKSIIQLLRNNNNLDQQYVDQLEKSVSELSQVSSNITSYDKLTLSQKDALDDMVKKTRGFANAQAKILKKGSGVDPKQYALANKTWESIKRGANNLQKYTGSIKHIKGAGRPTQLSGAMDTKQVDKMHKANMDELQSNEQIVKKVQVLKSQTIYPPVPSLPRAFTTEAPKDNKEGSFVIDNIMNVTSALLKGVQKFNVQLGSFVSQLGQAYSTMMNAFGSILDSPLESAVGMMSGMAQMISQGYDMIQGLFNAIADTISSIVAIFTGGSGEDGKNKASSVATNLVNQIASIITSLFNLAIQVIQAGFNIFASTLQAVFKLVKKIQDSSPIIRQILELITLAFNLFFMPFMNSFALVLLDRVVDLINWAVTIGERFGSKGQEILGILDAQGLDIDDILEKVKTIAEEFVENYLPDILKLIPELTAFLSAFTDSLLDNKDNLIGFIKSGLDAFKQMVDSGFLEEFLKLGVDVMQWISDNSNTIVSTIDTLMNMALNIATWFAGFFKTNTNVNSPEFKTAEEKILAQATDEELQQYNEQKGDFKKLAVLKMIAERHGIAQANGGVFHHTYNGGIPVLAGEGGENEYKLSEKELKEIGKDTTVTVQYNGSVMSTGDFKQLVRTTVSDVSNKSFFR